MIQWLYRIIYWPPINKVLLLLNRLIAPFSSFRLHPSGIIRIRIDATTSFLMSANQTSYVHKLLYWKGPCQFEYSPIFIELIKHCKVFIDVGANTGYYSILAARINNEIIVHAFEPAIGPSYYLKKNINLNDLNQVKDHSIALSSKIGNIKFYHVKNTKYSYLKHNLSGTSSLIEDSNKDTHIVETTTLDNFSTLNLTSLDLVKIDTEGTEDRILIGALEIIKKYKPIIICELLYKKIENSIEEILSKEGYIFFGYQDKKLIRMNSLIRKNDDGIRDCFCIHASKLEFIKTKLSNFFY